MKTDTTAALHQESSSAFPAFSPLPLSTRRTPGFTLIEVMLVIALMGILAATVVVRFTGLSRQRRLTDAVEEIVFFDRLSRADAMRFNRPELLVFDLDRQQIERVDTQTQEPRGKKLSLAQGGADGTHIDELRLGPTGVTHGQVSLPCSAQGITPSYALELSDTANQKRWLFVAGMTGQSQVLTTSEQVTALIEASGNANP